MSPVIGVALEQRRRRSLPPQASLVLRRTRRFVLSLLALVVLSFAMLQLIPGDPVRTALGPGADQQLVTETRAQLGLDRPVLEQFGTYLRDTATGDFGTSITTRQPVGDVLAQRLPGTLLLTALSFVLTLGVAVPLGLAVGVASRNGRRRLLGAIFTGTAGLLSVLPEFLLAVAMVFVLGVSLELLPVAGQVGWQSYIMPVLALSAAPTAVLARLVRVETTSALQDGYVQTARAKRLSRSTIYLRHVLPNAMTSALTVGGLLFGGLIAGTVLVENIFSWPGLGSTMVSSIIGKDYPVVQAIILVYGAGVLLVNLLIDLLLAWVDPRSSVLDN
ncbi:ABC transporter permease [Promicromonospora sp. NPDC057138]|uniref:ABC transporter permease n=1 Tax=Promicromonospora sp. NPDC057138 TaxID=3346031 RepID=UPI0036419A45